MLSLAKTHRLHFWLFKAYIIENICSASDHAVAQTEKVSSQLYKYAVHDFKFMLTFF